MASLRATLVKMGLKVGKSGIPQERLALIILGMV